MQFWFKIILIVITTLSLFSCSTTQKCSETPAIGNIGEAVNSVFDDYNPKIMGDSLYFTSNSRNENNEPRFLISKFAEESFEPPYLINKFPYQNYYSLSTPIYTVNPISGNKEMYFSASVESGRAMNIDIYRSVLLDNMWSEPKIIEILNDIKSNESNPSISKDGMFLIYSSDMKGGFGGTDLYISQRDEKGEWQQTKNMAENINTKYNENMPFLDALNNLWFSTDAFSKTNSDVVKSKFSIDGWQIPKILPFPINSDANDNSPVVIGRQLVLASERDGGCGGFDLYSFNICAPVVLETIISSDNEKLPIDGNIKLLSEDGNLIKEQEITTNYTIHFDLEPFNKYIIIYNNNCLSENTYRYYVEAPCSDSTVIKLKLNIELKSKDEFSFSKYDVPFFVSGYYVPNTKENLAALKLKFSYNLLGNSDSTRYIENPGEKYDDIAPVIDKAINDAIDFVIEKINMINSNCMNENQRINITIKGYTDPRTMSLQAKYVGENIIDKELDLKISKGDKLDNMMLAKLRAYYTALTLMEKLNHNELYTQHSDRISWKIEGIGIDEETNMKYELMRRADIEINISEE